MMARQKKELAELEQVRQRTLNEIARLREELQAELEPASATDDDAAADVASDIYERGKIISLIQSLEFKLRSVDNAIAAAEQGVYGICQMCGERIPSERLEIVPETTYCVRCASKMEQSMRRWQTDADMRRLPRRRRVVSDDELEDDDSDDELDEDLEDEDLGSDFFDDFEDGTD